MTASAVTERPHLTQQQRDLFDALAEREGATVSHADLNRAIGLSRYADTNQLKVVTCPLRKAIRRTGSEIQAVRGEGYRLYRAPGVTFPWKVPA